MQHYHSQIPMKELNKEISAACTRTANQFNKSNWKKAGSPLNKRSPRSISARLFSIMKQKSNRINHHFIQQWSPRLKLVKILVKGIMGIYYIKMILIIHKQTSSRIKVSTPITPIINIRICNLRDR